MSISESGEKEERECALVIVKLSLVTDGSCLICEENCKVVRRIKKRRESFEECPSITTVVNFVVVV